ncbi:hypothetical protein LshimejAT787_1203460 [Lyophyllum shimeji]|uniref:Uncharacterized protein n=1 Tax=Lyophyllum shimeji TaxID=47721 RepID=A0A9P3US56_LYOSH|nr:hypothetical protein LshimejAT787_1203460 [Lyophyllum shimeji]
MGQRHQAFLIARVVPHGGTEAHYRCVAAVHHGWCYGRLPLQATRRLLTLIKDEDNAEIIREEIRTLDGRYGRWKEEPVLPNLPCPYTSYLLEWAWSYDLPGHLRQICFSVDADVGYSETDNNGGISVIDITDPENPAYCFVAVHGLESEVGVPLLVPLSAEDYVRAYYPGVDEEELEIEGARSIEEDVISSITRLDGEPLVDLDMLAETWPGAGFSEG